MHFLKFLYYFLLTCIAVPQIVLAKGRLITLNENTWTEMLTGEWMVEFFAPWCPACQQLEPVWKDFAEWSDPDVIKVASIDITSSPGLSGRFMITALPTIYHVINGEFRQYRGARDKDHLFAFVDEKKWENIEPISSWKSPQSFQMATVSSFFKLSYFLRSMHNTLVDSYGLPYWGSYIVFGLVTILLGIVLGLLIVCFTDFFSKSKPLNQPLQNNVHELHEERHGSDGEFEGEDVIKEDGVNVGEFEGEDVIKEDNVAEDGDLRRRRQFEAGDE